MDWQEPHLHGFTSFSSLSFLFFPSSTFCFWYHKWWSESWNLLFDEFSHFPPILSRSSIQNVLKHSFHLIHIFSSESEFLTALNYLIQSGHRFSIPFKTFFAQSHVWFLYVRFISSRGICCSFKATQKSRNPSDRGNHSDAGSISHGDVISTSFVAQPNSFRVSTQLISQ